MNRNEFLEAIKKELYEQQFMTNGPDEYVLITEMRSPGRSVMINGQFFEEPGLSIPVKFIVRLMGPCEVSNLDGSNLQMLEHIDFKVGVEAEGRYEERGMGVCIYYEPEAFIKAMRDIFGRTGYQI